MTETSDPPGDLRWFAQISLDLGRAADAADAADIAVQYAAKVTGAALALVAQPDRRGVLRVLAASDPVEAAVIERAWVGSPHHDCAAPPAHERITVVDDFTLETRWSRFAATMACTTAYRSAMTVYLTLEDRLTGLLGLYHEGPAYFDPDVQVTAKVMADHTATGLALVEGHAKAANLHEALGTSHLIGEAIGILMVTRKVTADVGFQLPGPGRSNATGRSGTSPPR